MLVEVGVAVALLGGGAWWALRARRQHEHDLLDAMRARKYGFGRLAPLRAMDDDLPTVGLGLAMLGPLFADLDEARQQERLDREARRRLEALELHLNPPHLEAEDPEAPDVPQAPDLEALVAIALKERSHHITEVNEGMERHARGAVFEENVGLGVRIEEVDVEDTTIEDRVAREGGAAGQVQISLAWEDRNDLDLHVYAERRADLLQQPEKRLWWRPRRGHERTTDVLHARGKRRLGQGRAIWNLPRWGPFLPPPSATRDEHHERLHPANHGVWRSGAVLGDPQTAIRCSW